MHRFRVRQARSDNNRFNDLNRRMVRGSGTLARRAARDAHARTAHAAADAMARGQRARFDTVIFFTYLYRTTWAGSTAGGIVPTVLHPTVHDEPPLRLSIFDSIFRSPDVPLSTPEEIDLIRRRFRIEPKGAVIGIGVETTAADPACSVPNFGWTARRTSCTSGASTPARVRASCRLLRGLQAAIR